MLFATFKYTPQKKQEKIGKTLYVVLLYYVGYAKLMSEETLASDGSSEGEGPPGSQVNLMGGASGDLRHEQQLHQSQSGLPASDTE